jgi:hypothetical protein
VLKIFLFFSKNKSFFQKSLLHKEVQCSPVLSLKLFKTDVNEILTSEKVSEDYWKALALERQKALNDTLEENKSLCELVDVRRTEIEELEVDMYSVHDFVIVLTVSPKFRQKEYHKLDRLQSIELTKV